MAGPDHLADARAPLFALAPGGVASAEVVLPVDGATTARFRMVDSGTLPADLRRRFPALRSFRGNDATGRAARLDFARGTARLAVREADGRWLSAVSPLPAPGAASPGHAHLQPAMARAVARPTTRAAAMAAHGNLHYTFRLAVAADSHFVAANGGSRDAALGAIAHLVNRANEVLETDLGVSMVLAAHAERLVLTDTEGDALRHGEPMAAAVTLIERRLGARAYDIGHAFVAGRGRGGQPRTSCSDSLAGLYHAAHKAAAWSSGATTEHAFAAFVAGLGAQLGAQPVANLCTGCLAFHGLQIAQVRAWLGSRGGRCARKHVVDAAAPWIEPPPPDEPIVIPARTPFWLDALVVPSMPGRWLSYAWDAIDAQPWFDATAPQAQPRRAFTAPLPSTSRDMAFRLTVRDHGGAAATVASSDVHVRVVDTGRPFALASTGDAHAGGPIDIHWDPAGTPEPPIACHFLDATLSTDGGVSWRMLARDVANTGAARITLPAGITSDDARLRLACDWRPFFAESPTPFRIR
ncbi:hypothetical protein VI08_07675 [Luteibacter yeojuensis]|uniref:Uncharacterized protein n=1 Tax=Luteibacter yeojuensis TaxID=345309 RepID=A0A0F3KVY5_9GAMM|nr:hypothetical protein VI08_07675 [Luteibacter yeojuensis]